MDRAEPQDVDGPVTHVRKVRTSFNEHLKRCELDQQKVNALKAFFDATLPGVTAGGRLSVVSEVLPYIGVSIDCISSCVGAG